MMGGGAPRICLGEGPADLHVERRAIVMASKQDRIVNNKN